MIIETSNNETLIRIPSSIDIKIVQSIIEYLQIVEILMKNQGTEELAMQLAQEVDKSWWEANKQQFIK
jgi:hypothetical protein